MSPAGHGICIFRLYPLQCSVYSACMSSLKPFDLPPPYFTLGDFDSAQTSQMRLEKGAVLLFEGEGHKSDCYLILEGRLDIRLVTASGHETLLYKLQPGELVGELSLFGKVTRTATVTAVSPVCLLRIDASAFAQAMHNEDFNRRLMHHFVERYVRSHEVIQRLGQPKVSHKIARYLLSLEAWGDAPQNQISVPLVGHAELAMKLSCQRETVTRSMRDLTDQGVIETQANGRTIIYRDRLRQFLDA